MPRGELFINGRDAYEVWGVSLDSTGLSTLMTPPPNKEYVENKSRLQHGKSQVINNAKVDERTITVSINLTANSEPDFMNRYAALCEVFKMGKMEIRTKYQPNILYRMNYVSCTQFSQFLRQMAKFSLKLCEPNPENRDLIE